jgi:hypothetical membrane protein
VRVGRRRTTLRAVSPRSGYRLRRRLLVSGGAGGAAAPPLLAGVFLAVTLSERSFLRENGWSPVRRTEVEWPSLLELGPQGWIMQAGLICAAALGVAFAAALLAESKEARERVGAVALFLMSLAVAAMALPPDRPGSKIHSWHGVAHNGIYPLIPGCALVAAGMFALANSDRTGRSRASITFLAAASVSLALTLIASIAQAARFAFFGSLLVWTCYLGATFLLDVRRTF